LFVALGRIEANEPDFAAFHLEKIPLPSSGTDSASLHPEQTPLRFIRNKLRFASSDQLPADRFVVDPLTVLARTGGPGIARGEKLAEGIVRASPRFYDQVSAVDRDADYRAGPQIEHLEKRGRDS